MAKKQARFEVVEDPFGVIGYGVVLKDAKGGASRFHSCYPHYKRRSDAVKAIAWLKRAVLLARLEEDPPSEREAVRPVKGRTTA